MSHEFRDAESMITFDSELFIGFRASERSDGSFSVGGLLVSITGKPQQQILDSFKSRNDGDAQLLKLSVKLCLDGRNDLGAKSIVLFRKDFDFVLDRDSANDQTEHCACNDDEHVRGIEPAFGLRLTRFFQRLDCLVKLVGWYGNHLCHVASPLSGHLVARLASSVRARVLLYVVTPCAPAAYADAPVHQPGAPAADADLEKDLKENRVGLLARIGVKASAAIEIIVDDRGRRYGVWVTEQRG